MYSSRMATVNSLGLLSSLIVLAILSSPVQAEVPCDSDDFCQDLYNSPDTRCLPDSGTCSNPFQQGCLRAMMRGKDPSENPLLFSFDKPRVCNSADGDDPTFCVPSPLNYPELRIHNSNWESSAISAWIYQIILSELVQVPATVGLTNEHVQRASFYSSENVIEYSPTLYPYEAVTLSNEVEDCAVTDEPCVHVLPEVWSGQQDRYTELTREQVIEPVTSNGLLGRGGLRIPAMTAQAYPELGIWYGLAGEENRRKLAETFKRPVTWKDYCEKFSATNCSAPDPVASRYPFGVDDDFDSEEDLYFAQDLYTGYFHATDKNNCTANPTTCTGHVVTPPCSWSFPIDAQLFWNDVVGLERDGPVEPVGTYSGAQIVQIWRAANATRNHVIVYWYEPEPLVFEFALGDFQLQPVTFPLTTLECLDNLVSSDDRCNPDIQVRVGSEEGACGQDIISLNRVIGEGVGRRTNAKRAAAQSPGYELIRNVRISNLNMGQILRSWKGRNIDPSGNDLRAAVCEWVVENLDDLVVFIPAGYPRDIILRSQYDLWYIYLVRAITVFVATFALACFCAVVKYRNTKTMIFAQPFFMKFILLGFFMISIGAFLTSESPSKATCMSSSWLLLMGYTTELVPVLVKTARINRLVQSSKKQKRINLNRRAMIMEVASVMLPVVSFLVTWTITDPLMATMVLTLEEENPKTIESDLKCASDSNSWTLIAYGWEALLLFLAAVLAFQSRGVMEQLNESKSLAVMVYSHFLFVCLRGVANILHNQDSLPSNVISAIFSLLYSIDTLVAMCIYVVPKILAARNAPEFYKPGLSTSMYKPSSDTPTEEVGQEEGDLSLLVCTANLGNEAPDLESMEAWIPAGGSCSRVQPLEGTAMPHESFGLIAIGMQEATWTDGNRGESTLRGEVLSEEDVYNALEEENTAQLREMIQKVLGDEYCQIVDERRGQMRLHIWASRRVSGGISNVKISGANTGIGNLLANKGGIVVTVDYKKTRISFVSAHLAAHEGASYYRARCENVRSILREAKTFDMSSKFDIATSSHHSFFMGDLNFRCRFQKTEDHEEDVNTAVELINNGDFESVYQHDELHSGLAKGDLLAGYSTLKCTFPPTFKVERRNGYFYKKQRMPSWTDRILFKSSRKLSSNLKALSYEACEEFSTSDHKPIRGAFSLTPNQNLGTMHVTHEIQMAFHSIQCSDLPAGDSNGMTDPYVMFMWDSVDLYAENIAALDFFRQFWKGKSWPRTSYQTKTLNPNWDGDKVSLGIKNTTVGSDAMLFIAVVDYDRMGRDEFLGGVALSMRELIGSMRGTRSSLAGLDTSMLAENTLQFDLDLHRDGIKSGNIKFKLDFKESRDRRRRSYVLQALRSIGGRLPSTEKLRSWKSTKSFRQDLPAQEVPESPPSNQETSLHCHEDAYLEDDSMSTGEIRV